MFEKQIICESSEKYDAISSYELFHYVLKKEEKVDDNKLKLTFTREEKYNTKEMFYLEHKFFRVSHIPSLLIIVLMGISLVYVLVMLVLSLAKVIKFSNDDIKHILLIISPILLFLIAMLLSYIRNREINHYIKNKENILEEYKKKIEEIENGNKEA